MGLALGVVLGLVNLVAESVLGGGGTVEEIVRTIVIDKRRGKKEVLPSADGGVAVLGDVLVGFLGGSRGSLLDLLADVVGTLLDGIHCDGWLLFESGL